MGLFDFLKSGSTQSFTQTVETVKSFYLLVNDVHVSIGRGTVVIGHVQGGSIKYEDTAYLIKNNGEIINTKILGISSTQTLDLFVQSVAEVGERVGLLLRGIIQEDVNKGDFISATRKLPDHVLFLYKMETKKHTVDYYAIADKLAHSITWSIGESEVDEMENKLLAGGADALTAILTYLLHCGQGKQSQGWWSNAKRLVRLIRRFPNEDYANILTQLINYSSNIWEYQTQVKEVAEDELKMLKSPPIIESPPVEKVEKPAEKIDRTISDDMRIKLEQEEPLLSTTYHRAGTRISLKIMQDGVLIGDRLFIPYSDIRKVVWLPIETNRPICGGCLVFVTDDCPDLPIRNDHSFHMPNESGITWQSLSYNCCFHNCLYIEQTAKENADMEKVKALVESKIKN